MSRIVIKTEAQYKTAKTRFDILFKSKDAGLKSLAKAIQAYEKKRYNVGNPSPTDMVIFLDDQGLVKPHHINIVFSNKDTYDAIIAGNIKATKRQSNALLRLIGD